MPYKYGGCCINANDQGRPPALIVILTLSSAHCPLFIRLCPFLQPFLGAQVSAPGSSCTRSAVMDKADLTQATSKGDSDPERSIRSAQEQADVIGDTRPSPTVLGRAYGCVFGERLEALVVGLTIV